MEFSPLTEDIIFLEINWEEGPLNIHNEIQYGPVSKARARRARAR